MQKLIFIQLSKAANKLEALANDKAEAAEAAKIAAKFCPAINRAAKAAEALQLFDLSANYCKAAKELAAAALEAKALSLIAK